MTRGFTSGSGVYLLNPDCLIVTAQRGLIPLVDYLYLTNCSQLNCIRMAGSAPYRTPSPLPLCTSMLAAARRGSSKFWPQTDRLKTDIAGGSSRRPSPLNSHSFINIQYCSCRHQFLTQIGREKDDACPVSAQYCGQTHVCLATCNGNYTTCSNAHIVNKKLWDRGSPRAT